MATGNSRVVPGVRTSDLLERGAREMTTGKKPNKANPLVFLGYRKPWIRDLTEAGLELAGAIGH